MKLKTTFHLLVATLLAFGVVSCGSDNSASSGSVDTTVTTPTVSIGTGNGARTSDEFYNEVAADQFEQASSVGVYAFKRTTNKGFKFNYCSGNSCLQKTIDSYAWRHLQSSQNIRRRFDESGFSFSGPNTDSQFGSTLSGIREGLLTIIRNSESVQKCVNYVAGYRDTDTLVLPNNIRETVRMPNKNVICYQWVDVNVAEGGFGSTNLSDKYSKLFKFDYNNTVYHIDLHQPLILNPIAVFE